MQDLPLPLVAGFVKRDVMRDKKFFKKVSQSDVERMYNDLFGFVTCKHNIYLPSDKCEKCLSEFINKFASKINNKRKR